jgi:amino acid transporter
MVYCRNCGGKLAESNKFCPACGAPIGQQYQKPYTYPYPYPYPYQQSMLHIVVGVMVLIAGVFLLLTGILSLLLFILGYNYYLWGFETLISSLIGFIGFVFSAIASINIFKKRKYQAAFNDTIVILILCIVLFFTGAPNLFALVFSILGLVFLHISKTELFRYDQVNQYSDRNISYSPPQPTPTEHPRRYRNRDIEKTRRY